jgi:hypothetical protein
MEDGFMCKRFLLSASIITLLSSQAFATKQDAIDLADKESNQQAIINKLMGSNDYTFSLDEEGEAERIKNDVLVLKKKNEGGKEPTPQQIADLKFEAKYKIRSNLESLKNNPVHIGYGYYTGSNYNDVLSTTSHRNPLAYPVFSAKGDRDEENSFLPKTYKSNFLSRALRDEIRYYAYHNGLSEDDAQKLNKYVQPIFYITQLEVMKLLEGDKNLTRTKKWVYDMGYDDIVKSIQSQTDHHHTLIKKANIRGLDSSVIETSLVPKLIDLSFALLSNPKRELYVNNNGQKYLLGRNKKGFVSLIHPDTNLPYPIFKDQRPKGDMNLPEDYQSSSLLTTQWQRVGTFLSEKDMLQPVQIARLKVLLEPVAYMAHEHFKTLRIYLSNELLQATLQRFMDARLNPQPQRGQPESYVHVLYRHVFLDQEAEDGLKKLENQVKTHQYLVEDLYPEGLQVRDQDMLSTDLLEYLITNEIIDRVRDKLQNQFVDFVENLRARGNY